MALCVVLKGLPSTASLQALACHLDKFLDTDEIGSFRVRKLAPKLYKWQVVMIFNSSYDAFTAQSILQGFKYKWDDDTEYVLAAKLSEDPSLQFKNQRKLANMKTGLSSSSSLVHMTQEVARNCGDIPVPLSHAEDQDVTTYTPPREKRCPDEFGPKRKSRSSSVSRSPDLAVPKSIVRKISSNDMTSPPSYSASGVNTKALAVKEGLVHTRMGRHKSPKCSESDDRSRSQCSSSPERPRSPKELSYDQSRTRNHCEYNRRRETRRESREHRKSYRRSESREHSGSYRRSESREHSGPYRRSESREHSRSYGRSESRKHSGSYRRSESREHSRPYRRSESREHSRLYRRSESRKHSGPYRRSESCEHSGSYRRSESREHSGSKRRRKSRNDSNSNRRPKSSKSRTNKSHGRPKSYARSPEYSRSSRRSRDYDSYENMDRRSSCIEPVKYRRYYYEPSSSKHRSKNTNQYNVKKSYPSATNAANRCVKQEHIVKQEIKTENEHDDFKLEINTALSIIMKPMKSLLDDATIGCLCERDRQSIVKTLRTILARRLRSLPLEQHMIWQDILHLYKYRHDEKDDCAMIAKLLQQLSEPEIVIEDTDMTELPDADDMMWLVINEVLKDLKMDFENKDSLGTVILSFSIGPGPFNYLTLAKYPLIAADDDKTRDEVVDKDVAAILSSIQTEKLDEDIKTNIQELMMVEDQDWTGPEVVAAPKKKKKKAHKKKKKCGPRNKVYDAIDISNRTIPAHPRFYITVTKVMKKLKPHIQELHGDISIWRILEITTYEIRKKIKELVQGKPYMKASAITALYRLRYPMDADVKFVHKIITKFKNGIYRDVQAATSSLDIEDQNSDEFKKSIVSTDEGTDELVIIENNPVIVVVEDEGDESKDVIEKTSQVPCNVVE